MSKGQVNIAKDQDEVAVLFADICDWDLVIRHEKHMIVKHLDDLFRSFDMLCQ